ncbi:MAG TPA: TRAP transporter TatT component family protein [Polyangia bacterium]
MRAAAAVITLALAIGGCISKRTAAFVDPPTPFGTVSQEILDDLVADGDRAYKARADKKQLDEANRAYGAALRYDPTNAAILVRLGQIALRRSSVNARGAGASAYLDEATGYAERALAARNPKLLAAARAANAKPADVFSHAEPADAPALALYAEALLGWSVMHGTATVMKKRDWIHAAAERALALDPAAGWAAPNRVLATLDCELPHAGENLHDAMVRFEAAVAVVPAYLPTRVAYAEEYATRTSDETLYRRLLAEVLAANPSALPDAAAENADAQKTARKLLGRK